MNIIIYIDTRYVSNVNKTEVNVAVRDFNYGKQFYSSSKRVEPTGNRCRTQRDDLLGLITAIDYISKMAEFRPRGKKEKHRIMLEIADKSLQQSLTKLIPKWKKNNWKKLSHSGGKVKNQDLLKYIDNEMQRHGFEFQTEKQMILF
tara:strand:- start:41 stop:478 length:438 start_codon:yes stop_codon:yes gene_type:complete